VEHARRVCQGYEFTEETMAVAAIEEVALGAGNFLGHETTLANYREATWNPTLFVHNTLRQWQDKGMPELVGQARQIAVKRIAQGDYVLDAEARRDLDALYERARREAE